jgi:hypothetical protein
MSAAAASAGGKRSGLFLLPTATLWQREIVRFYRQRNRIIGERYRRGEAGLLEFTEFYLSTLAFAARIHKARPSRAVRECLSALAEHHEKLCLCLRFRLPRWLGRRFRSRS